MNRLLLTCPPHERGELGKEASPNVPTLSKGQVVFLPEVVNHEENLLECRQRKEQHEFSQQAAKFALFL